MKTVLRGAGLPTSASPYTVRHSFAIHLLEDGHDVSTVQVLLGHRDVTTMIYPHVLNRGPAAVRSPADRTLGPRPRPRPWELYASGYAAPRRSLSRLGNVAPCDHKQRVRKAAVPFRRAYLMAEFKLGF